MFFTCIYDIINIRSSISNSRANHRTVYRENLEYSELRPILLQLLLLEEGFYSPWNLALTCRFLGYIDKFGKHMKVEG
jgi:hypothetical protein